RSKRLSLQDFHQGRILYERDALFGVRRYPLVFGLSRPSSRFQGLEKRVQPLRRGSRSETPPPRSKATSPAVKSRHLPISRFPMRTGPMAVRTSFNTLLPTASIIRRTCRFRPSVRVISITVYLALSRNRSTAAGRVGPSLRTTPLRRDWICASLSTVDA